MTNLTNYVLLVAFTYALGRKHVKGDDFPVAMPIINGRDVVVGEFVMAGMLLYRGRFFCGVCLLSTQTVITASHCVQEKNHSLYSVRLGEFDRLYSEGTEVTLNVDTIKRHPTRDIALLHLSEHVTVSASIQPIRVDLRRPTIGEMKVIVGWGLMEADRAGARTSRYLQKLTLPVTNISNCIRDGMIMTEDEFCIGERHRRYTNACRGDSGGPVLVQTENGTYYLQGIISRGPKNCNIYGDFSAHTFVYDLTDWISGSQDSSRPHSARNNPDARIRRNESDDRQILLNSDRRGLKCFPGSAIVTTKVGRKKMQNVRVGDLVLSGEVDGNAIYSEVIMFMHLERNSNALYKRILAGNSTSVVMSEKHLTFHYTAKDTDVSKKAIYAGDLKPGQYVKIVEDDGTYRFEEVAQISDIYAEGIYAPLTNDGEIVINGVQSSCYAHVGSHIFAHYIFYPYKIWSYIYSYFSILSKIPISNDNFIHWYPNIFLNFVSLMYLN